MMERGNFGVNNNLKSDSQFVVSVKHKHNKKQCNHLKKAPISPDLFPWILKGEQEGSHTNTVIKPDNRPEISHRQS